MTDHTCGVCGAASRQRELGPLDTMGPPDLDLRPAPVARWMLAEQIQRCPECGYCARDISVATESANAVVRNETYLAELTREEYPEVTRRCLCASLILSLDGDDGGAGRAALMGAWAADDLSESGPDQGRKASAEVAAAHCRRLAIGYFEADRRRGTTFAADEASADAMLADLNRRVGDFEAARAHAHAGLQRGVQGFVRKVFEHQLWLADAGDIACHNVSEVWDGGGEDCDG